MQIDLLDTFLDLMESRSFHRTAERLHLTQSSISARIQTLEGAVGARLFTRSRAGTELTTEGLKFAPHARALRHAWAQAQRDVAASIAVSLHIGIQHDLVSSQQGGQIGQWVAAFRRALPDCGFYIEPDYSSQMCADIARGKLDFAVIYTPHLLPDLHVTSLGDVTYRLISSGAVRRADLTLDRYVRASFAPAFDMAHSAVLPEMAGAPLATGQNAAMVGLLTAGAGAGFVLASSAEDLVASGSFGYVSDVAPLTQPVYAAVHLRNRTSGIHKRLSQIVQRMMGAGPKA